MLFQQKFLSCLIVLSVFCCACENEMAKVNVFVTNTKKLPAVSQANAEIIYSDSAVVKASLRAVQLDRYAGDSTAYLEFPKGVKMFFYDENLDTTSRMKADYAIKYDSKHTMEARGNVEIINVKGERMNGEQLIWDQLQRRIYSNTFVKITTADEVIMGDGFDSNEDFSKYKIKKIRGTISLGD